MGKIVFGVWLLSVVVLSAILFAGNANLVRFHEAAHAAVCAEAFGNASITYGFLQQSGETRCELPAAGVDLERFRAGNASIEMNGYQIIALWQNLVLLAVGVFLLLFLFSVALRTEHSSAGAENPAASVPSSGVPSPAAVIRLPSLGRGG